MGTVTGITIEKAQEIEDASVASGHISGNNLYLTTKGGTELNAGQVVPDIPPPPYSHATQVAPSGNIEINTSAGTPTMVTGLSTTVSAPEEGATYVVTLDLEYQVTGSGTTSGKNITFALMVDGVANTRTITSKFATTGGEYFSITWLVTGLSTGDHTLAIRATAAANGELDSYLITARQNPTRMTVVGHQVT